MLLQDSRQSGSNSVTSASPVTRPQSAKAAPRSINECVGDFAPAEGGEVVGNIWEKLNTCREECQTRTNTGLN